MLHPGPAMTLGLFSTHLTDNEHVLAPDDALLHLGAQSLPNIYFIAVAVSSVYMAIASSNGSLYCALDWGAGQVGGLQQVKHFRNKLFTLLPYSIIFHIFFNISVLILMSQPSCCVFKEIVNNFWMMRRSILLIYLSTSTASSCLAWLTIKTGNGTTGTQALSEGNKVRLPVGVLSSPWGCQEVNPLGQEIVRYITTKTTNSHFYIQYLFLYRSSTEI